MLLQRRVFYCPFRHILFNVFKMLSILRALVRMAVSPRTVLFERSRLQLRALTIFFSGARSEWRKSMLKFVFARLRHSQQVGTDCY